MDEAVRREKRRNRLRFHENEREVISMICKSCGGKIPNGAGVCPECGGDLSPNVPRAKPNAVLLKEETDHVIIWYIKKKTVLVAVAALAALVVIANVLSAAVSFFSRIDFTEYVIPEVSGYDGRGTLSYYVDSDALSSKLFGKDPSDLEGAERRVLNRAEELLHNGITCEPATRGLSNGDEITIHIDNLDALSEATDQKCKKK